MNTRGTRMLVIRLLDWPILAAGLNLAEPSAIINANNRVLACSPAAQQAGIKVGQRRREAQRICPTMGLLVADKRRDAQKFEPIIESLEAISPVLEVLKPGMVGFPTLGPSRFFGGDQSLADRTMSTTIKAVTQLDAQYNDSVRIGIADGAFAATLAASTEASPTHIIEPAESASFLANQPVAALGDEALVEVLQRLGLKTLGAWAALSVADVSGRFGRKGITAHRISRGLDGHPPELCRPAPEFTVRTLFEPPAESVAQCGFMAEPLAEQLLKTLRSQGLSCIRLGVEAETENGALLKRWWRYSGASLSAKLIADRVMSQLDSWLLEDESKRPRSPILRLALIPDEVVSATGKQLALTGLGLNGIDDSRAEQVGGVVNRLQSMLGVESVLVPKRAGGVGPGEQVSLEAADSFELAKWEQAEAGEPWPAQVPAPAPARVLASPERVGLLDRAESTVVVGGRGELEGEPAWLEMGATRLAVLSWAGPWLDDQRWWDATNHRRRARVQLVADSGRAYLLVSERQRWWLEAAYD